MSRPNWALSRDECCDYTREMELSSDPRDWRDRYNSKDPTDPCSLYNGMSLRHLGEEGCNAVRKKIALLRQRRQGAGERKEKP